ncbi:MAG: hypothetical protein WBA17_03355 [Saprospiraceae bacterium]
MWEGPTQAATAGLPYPVSGSPGKPVAFLAGPLGRKKPDKKIEFFRAGYSLPTHRVRQRVVPVREKGIDSKLCDWFRERGAVIAAALLL